MLSRSRLAVLSISAIALLLAVAAGEPAATAQEPTIVPGDFQTIITNPLFPISLTGPKLLEGTDTDEAGKVTKTRLESKVLPGTRVVMGVTVTVLEERAYDDGELIELALDFFAQHRDGSVYYFGEEVDNYEDGKLKDHHGEWLAGEGEDRPGIIMPASPKVGETYIQEHAPGIAEDAIDVLALDETVTTPAGVFTGCLKTRDYTPLEPGVSEFKWHCPGIGLVREEGVGSVNQLISPKPAPQPTAPVPAATPPGGIVAPNTGTGHATDDGTEGRRAATVMLLLTAIAALGIATARMRRQASANISS